MGGSRNKRFKEVYEQIRGLHKVGDISEKLGYSTTRQLYNVLEDKNVITSSALYYLVKNFKVNPLFLFHGEGEMFSENPLKESQDLFHELTIAQQQKNELIKKSIQLANMVKDLENKNFQLQDNFNSLIADYKQKIARFVREGKLEEEEIEKLPNNKEDITIIDKVLNKGK